MGGASPDAGPGSSVTGLAGLNKSAFGSVAGAVWVERAARKAIRLTVLALI